MAAKAPGDGPPPALVLFTGWPGTGKSTLADVAGRELGAPVLGWDWVMGALTPFTAVQDALDAMDRPTYRAVGWSLLWSLAESQLRRGQPVVLDGVARQVEVDRCRALATAHGARSLVVWCLCDDEAAHRSRVEGRQRDIPGWHELTWADIESARSRVGRPDQGIDLTVDAADPVGENIERLRAALAL